MTDAVPHSQYTGERNAAGQPHTSEGAVGRLVFAGGGVWEGRWNQGMHVAGKKTFVSGEIQEGTFLNNELHGAACTMVWPNGDRYSGSMSCGLFDGIGFSLKASTCYHGEFKRSQPSGFGAKWNAEGRLLHCGRWADDRLVESCPVPLCNLPSVRAAGLLPHSDAALLYPNGDCFVGPLNERYQPHGTGALYNAAGAVAKRGLWEAGRYRDANAASAPELKCSECGLTATHMCSQCEAYFCAPHCEEAHTLQVFKGHPIRHLGPRLRAPARVIPAAASAPSPAVSSSSASISTAVLVIDLLSFIDVLRPSSLPMLLRTLSQLAHDADHRSIRKVIFLRDPICQSHTPLAQFNLESMAIETVVIAWDEVGKISSETVDAVAQASQCRIPQRDLVVFASSRAHMFRPLIDRWMRSDSSTGVVGSSLMFVHGHRKLPFGLSTAEPDAAKLAERGIALRPALPELQNQLTRLASGDMNNLSLYMRGSLVSAYSLLSALWPEECNNSEWLSIHRRSRIKGVFCLWDLSPWCEIYEQAIPAVPRADQPAPACVRWNAQLPCGLSDSSMGRCSFTHHCQACAGQHRLSSCPVNRILLHVPDFAAEKHCAAVSWLSQAALHIISAQSKQFSAPAGTATPLYRMPQSEQLHHCKLVSLPSVVLHSNPHQSGADRSGLLPCEAVVWIDWKNIHPPANQLIPFFEGITDLLIKQRVGVKAIRVMHIVMDRSKMPVAAAELDRLSTRFKLNIIDVLAAKAQAADSRLSAELRTVPRTAVFGEREADLVMLVSGDSDFTSDLCRLALAGHRIVLVHNRQAKKTLTRNCLWESAVDFTEMEKMRPYAQQQKERRAMRNEARQAQENPISLQVSSMRLRTGDLAHRMPGMSGACMDVDGHALLLTDSQNDRLFRFDLAASSGSDDHDPLSGSLQLLAGCGSPRSVQVHYIVCVNIESNLPALSALHDSLQTYLSSADPRALASVIRFGDAVHEMNRLPLPVSHLPAFGASNLHSSANPRLLFDHLRTRLEQLDAMDNASHVELLMCTHAKPFTATAHAILASMLIERQSSSDSGKTSLSCTFLSPKCLPDDAAALDLLPSVNLIIAENVQSWPDDNLIAAQFRAAPIRNLVMLNGPATHSHLSQPTEVCVDPMSGLIFVCDSGHSRIAVLDRVSNQLSTLTPTVSGIARHPRDLFLDSRHRRLWITEMANATLGFYNLTTIKSQGNSVTTAVFTVVRTSLHPGVKANDEFATRLTRIPGSKCLSANGRDLIFCDERLQAFCQLTESNEGQWSSNVLHYYSPCPSTVTNPLRACPSPLAPSSDSPLNPRSSLLDRVCAQAIADRIKNPFFSHEECALIGAATSTAVERVVHHFQLMRFRDWPAIVTALHNSRIQQSNAASVCHHLDYAWNAPAEFDQPDSRERAAAKDAWDSAQPLAAIHSLLLDSDGSYLFADGVTHQIKRLVQVRGHDAAASSSSSSSFSHWKVSLVAGRGQVGLEDDEACNCLFKFPAKLVADPAEAGALYICEQGNRRLRKLHAPASRVNASGIGLQNPFLHPSLFLRPSSLHAASGGQSYKPDRHREGVTGSHRNSLVGFVETVLESSPMPQECEAETDEEVEEQKQVEQKEAQELLPQPTATTVEPSTAAVASAIDSLPSPAVPTPEVIVPMAPVVAAPPPLPRLCVECELYANVYCSTCNYDFCDNHSAQLHVLNINKTHKLYALLQPLKASEKEEKSTSAVDQAQSAAAPAAPVNESAAVAPALPAAASELAVASALPVSPPAAFIDSLPMFFCPVCDKIFNGEMQLMQHREGTLHKRNADRLAEAHSPHVKRTSPIVAPVLPLPSVLPTAQQMQNHIPTVPVSSAELIVAQHRSFQEAHPAMQLQSRTNPNKEPSYRCMVCPMEPLAGPIHRALAHTNTAEHKQHVALHAANQAVQAKVRPAPLAVSFVAPAAAPLKKTFPLTTDQQALIIHRDYLRLISQSARAALGAFSEFEQLQIVKEVDLWNRQTPTGKEGKPYNLSARVVHVCKLKHEKQQQARVPPSCIAPILPPRKVQLAPSPIVIASVAPAFAPIAEGTAPAPVQATVDTTTASASSSPAPPPVSVDSSASSAVLPSPERSVPVPVAATSPRVILQPQPMRPVQIESESNYYEEPSPPPPNSPSCSALPPIPPFFLSCANEFALTAYVQPPLPYEFLLSN